ncbi:beta-microseminoprotein-like [Acanthaster planci]|uniref:Beta-microseminoprotein-like n=1 Tax=Acanthaster planci TaxID=133434 RepID=A0A8B7YDS4_ACAPL|nr:beta-microseminoprotein-like [Acanthaster planci]
MVAFTQIVAVALFFLVGADALCDIVSEDVECMVGEMIEKDLRIPAHVSTTCMKCMCIQYKRSTAVQCCSIALKPTGYDELRCEMVLDTEKCIYTVRKIDRPNERCRFSGFIME